MTGLRSRASRVRRKLRGDTVSARAKRSALSRSGIVDLEWFSAVTGKSFTSVEDAIEFYLDQPQPRPALSPWVEAGEPSKPGQRRDALVASLVRSGRFPQFPFFDRRQLTVAGGGKRQWLAAVKEFGPNDLVPADEDWVGPVPTYGRWREAMLAAAQNLSAQQLSQRANRHSAPLPVAAQTSAATGADSATVTAIVAAEPGHFDADSAAASLKRQGDVNLDIIVVTSAVDVVSAFTESLFPTARLIIVDGPSATFAQLANAGIRAANTDYVAFVPTDGLQWTPGFLASALRPLQGGVGAAVRAVVVDRELGPEGQVQGEERFEWPATTVAQLLTGRDDDLGATVITRQALMAIDCFDESLPQFSAYDLLIRLARAHAITQLPSLGCQPSKPSVEDSLGAQTSQIQTVPSSDQWEFKVRGEHWIDWQALADGQADRVADRISVVMPTFNDWKMTVSAVRSVLKCSTGFDVEVVVVDNGSEPSYSLVLAGALSFDPRIRLIRQPLNLNFALGSNVGFAESTGQTVLFLNNDTDVRAGWLTALVDGLADPDVRGVQPLLLYPDETIQSAGTVLPDCGGLPSHFLVGFPADDAYALGTIDCAVVTAAALAMRASDVIALRGFDTTYLNGWEDVDLCLRAIEDWGGHFRVTASSVVVHHESKTPGRGKHIAANRALFTHRWSQRMPPSDAIAHWRRAGFEVPRWDPGTSVSPGAGRAPVPVLLRPESVVLDGRAAGLPALRWAIKIAAWPGPRGEHWGDVHFAADLARSLRRLGQDVVVDPRTSTQRTTGGLDDVVLVLRGLDEVDPQPGRVNMMWVISHPDMVSAAELARFDLCFAAGAPWAQQMTKESGIAVHTLLQATDPERFHPGVAEPDTGEAVLFVGGSRRQLRPIVRDSIAARLDLAVYGGGWRGDLELPAGVLRGEYLPNQVVPTAYRSAGVVLSDHWADMATAGFLSNRLFDAVGAGARVVSDDVPGIADVFGDAVAVYQTVADLERLCSPEGRSLLPTEDQLQIAAQNVRREHSFDARAWELLNAAVLARG